MSVPALLHPAPHPVARIVRRRANRTAASFEASSNVHAELGRRLLEHLDPIRLAPARVLDLGCATGRLTRALVTRFPNAQVIGVDHAQRRLGIAKRAAPKWFARERYLCADALSVPLKDNSVDLVCANLLLPWIVDLRGVFMEAARVLRHGGLIMLNSLGPDTLRELYANPRGDALYAHPMLDMHQVADALVAAGFCDVVADAEHLSADYRGPADLIAELRSTGSSYAGARSSPTLKRHSVVQTFATAREPNPFSVTFEAVYLHAWYLDRQSVEVASPAPLGSVSSPRF